VNLDTIGIEKLLMGGENMTRRIVIPVINKEGLNAQLSQHFGRAPYFVVVDIGDDAKIVSQQTITNDSEHFGGVGRPPDRILQLSPHALITYGMGPRALNIFQNAQVAVLRTTAFTVGDVVTLYNTDALEELTEGCHHARHHE
jgi:predicted Fe-Mo cluster-binding NifX family protein